nr:unnamed protein product [Spirometra erinaceieuropaei]
MEEFVCETLFFLMRKCTGTVITRILKVAKTSPYEKDLKFIQAMALLVEEQFEQALMLLNEIKEEEEFKLSSLLGMVHAYKNMPDTENKKITELDTKIKSIRKTATDQAKYLYGLIPQANTNKDSRMDAMSYFKTASSEESRENLFGIAKYYRSIREFSNSLDRLNDLITLYPEFIPALVEKIDVLLAMGQWERALDAASRCLDIDGKCVDASKYKVFHALCRGGNYMQVLCSLDKHYNLLCAVESNNRFQFEQTADLIYKLSGRNTRLLKKAYQFAERALEISPNSFSSMFTMAKISFAQGSHKEAMRYLKKAMKLNESSVETMCSIVNCQLVQHCLKDAKLQLELLEELEPTIGSSPMVLYLQAILLLEEGRPIPDVLAKLDQAVDLHFKNLKKATPSIEYYCEMDPDFLLQLVDAYFNLSVQPTPIPAGIEKSLRTVDVLKMSTMWPNTQHILSRCQKILGDLTDALPGLQWANYLFAYLHLTRGDYNQALSFSQAALEIDPTCSTAHVLQAQIYLAQSNLRRAEQTLEIGLSNNFELRNHPLNSLVQAKIHMQDLVPEKAIELLNQALTNPEAPGFRSMSAASPGSGRIRDARDVIQGNSRRKQAYTEFWTTIYLEIVTAYRSQGKFREAAKTLSEAQQVFSGTAEADRLAIAAADVAVADADLDTALTVLRPIPSDTPYYLIAKQRMADIYLNQRKEKRLYIACYREMVETMGNSLSQLLLGDAYMRIQDPQKAIEVYEAVLRKNPDDLTLASKMGEALVMTHEYERAIAYYESAVHGGQLSLQSDLTVLLIKLRQFSKAEELLMDSYNSLIDSTQTVDLQRSSDVLILMAIIYGQQGRQEEQLETLDRAKLKQMSIMQSVGSEESTDLVRACKRILTSILVCMGQVYLNVHLSTTDAALDVNSPTREKTRCKDKEEAGAGDEDSRATPAEPPSNLELAIECCNNAIKEINSMHPPDLPDRIKHTTALSLLARCYLASRDRAPCEQTCLKLAMLQEELFPQLKRDRQHTLEVRLEMFHPLVADRTPGGSTQATYPVRVGDCGVKFVPAAIIMSDLQTAEGNFAGACPHLEKQIAEEPDDAEALIRLVKSYRRMGQLPKASVILDKLDKVVPGSQTCPGHKFARGLYHWYIGDSSNALKHFNLARLDAAYMEEATANMVEICLNPNNRVIGSLIFDTERRLPSTDLQRTAETGAERATSGYGDSSGMDAASLAVSSSAGGDSAEAVGHQTAERLLKTLSAKKDKQSIRFLTNLHLSLSKNKASLDKAFNNFAQMNTECESVAAIYGAAVCYMLLRQPQRAKNTLKRLAKYSWTPESAEFLEKSWLLLADIYIAMDKPDMAHELLKRCLQFNQAYSSCSSSSCSSSSCSSSSSSSTTTTIISIFIVVSISLSSACFSMKPILFLFLILNFRQSS